MDACSFEDGLRLVKLRGESMQAAADQKPSAMVSVIGLSSEKVSVVRSQKWRKSAMQAEEAALLQCSAPAQF